MHKRESWAVLTPSPSPLQFMDGDLVWWMGQQIPIRWVPYKEALPGQYTHAEFQDLSTLPIWEECTDRLSAVTAWYVTHALTWFRPRTQYFAEKLGRYPRSIKVTHAKGRWGSCNRLGVIRLNWRLMKASPAEIDYVIAHECAHLVHMNHSADFWNTVNHIHPNWKPISKLLNTRDPQYRSF
jgi:predicted metal-dependent hydrolase